MDKGKEEKKELSSLDKRDITESISAEGDVSKTLIKLLNREAEVQIYKYKGLVESMREQLSGLEKAIKDMEGTENYVEALSKTKSELEKAEKEVIHGYLTPITYREIQLVKMGIAEAQLEARKMGYDIDVQLLASIREQRALTVYFSLKTMDEKRSRYFKNLEEIAVLPDDCIDELFDLYMKHIGLTPEEIKNS